jgi:hypothetical protein
MSAANSSILADIKSKQYMLIARAGMAIPSYEMSADQIHANMMTQFKYHVESFKLPPNLSAMPKERLFRTSNHLATEARSKDMHTGLSLWRKYSQIKKYVKSMITPIMNRHLGPDGNPPSGHNMESILFMTRQHLYEAEQLLSKNKSKNPAAFVMRPFKVSWYPVEWEVFVTFGKPSDKPEKAFLLE